MAPPRRDGRLGFLTADFSTKRIAVIAFVADNMLSRAVDNQLGCFAEIVPLATGQFYFDNLAPLVNCCMNLCTKASS